MSLPQKFLYISRKIGLLGPAVILESLTDVAFYVGLKRTSAVVVLVVAFAGVDVDKVVLDGTLHSAWHVVVNLGEADGHADGLVVTELRTVLALHLGIPKVDAGDVDSVLWFVSTEQAVQTVITMGTYCTEAGLIVVCLLCEDFFAGLWSLGFLFHIQ